VNDEGCSAAAEPPPLDVVVSPELDELLDELPQALAARRTPTVTAKNAVLFETRITASFQFEMFSL
jgi:hypothetical protein